MGRQVNFYMSLSDENEFLSFVASTGDVVYLAERAPSSAKEDFVTEYSKRPNETDFCLWNRSISPPPAYRGDLFRIDLQISEVVNFDRSWYSDSEMRIGRIYVDTDKREPDGTYSRKRLEFLRWYEKLAKWIRISLRKLERGLYIGKEADLIRHQGLLRLEGTTFVKPRSQSPRPIGGMDRYGNKVDISDLEARAKTIRERDREARERAYARGYKVPKQT